MHEAYKVDQGPTRIASTSTVLASAADSCMVLTVVFAFLMRWSGETVSISVSSFCSRRAAMDASGYCGSWLPLRSICGGSSGGGVSLVL